MAALNIAFIYFIDILKPRIMHYSNKSHTLHQPPFYLSQARTITPIAKLRPNQITMSKESTTSKVPILE